MYKPASRTFWPSTQASNFAALIKIKAPFAALAQSGVSHHREVF